MCRVISRVTDIALPGSACSLLYLSDHHAFPILEVRKVTSPSVRYLRAPELLSRPTVSPSFPVPGSSLVGYLEGDQDVSNCSSILPGFSHHIIPGVPPSVSRVHHYWCPQDHASEYVTLTSSYTSLPPLDAVGQFPGYPQETGDVSTSGDLDYDFARPMGLGSIAPFHDHTAGEVINSNALWLGHSSPLLPLLQELRPSNDFTSENVPSTPEQIRTEMQDPVRFLSSFAEKPITQTHLAKPFPYGYPTPTQSNSTSYPTVDDYISSHLDPISSFQSLHGYLGTPPPRFHGFRVGTNMESRTTSTLDDHTARMIFDAVDDYGKIDTSKYSSESLSGPFHDAGRSATSQSRTLTTLPKTRSICDRNVCSPCGWRNDDGKECGIPITYGDCKNHLAAVHNIKNIAWYVEIICRWCSSKAQKKVKRKNMLRHLREVHLCHTRPKKDPRALRKH
ncbi:hypothetical protein F5J12DRAFT_863453 [Pisolithus orientalis]|uniref:uncharacterized protein n=1 Tax=Pisolithus orientalis TaxID=936130 RepID=UPI00222447D0|nr:uncharacterized protein F5J12DRAFT_863453 [Pisolithus orientalis]KAI5990043.1 hypothetical protein F5J12DRAFT_863453 [Pisolithus orientalis]